MGKMFMFSEARKRKKGMMVIDIGEVVRKLDHNVVRNLLFIHAWGGCDSTSAIFNQGKTTLLRLVEKGRKEVLDICSVFNTPTATTDEIGTAGIKLFAILYGKLTSAMVNTKYL